TDGFSRRLLAVGSEPRSTTESDWEICPRTWRCLDCTESPRAGTESMELARWGAPASRTDESERAIIVPEEQQANAPPPEEPRDPEMGQRRDEARHGNRDGVGRDEVGGAA